MKGDFRMRIHAIVFFTIMVLGAILNFSARKICEKYFAESCEQSMLKMKLTGLFLVLAGVILLMIFGK